ncbi:hypothetical protein BDQ12DRAFT_666642 [Crucibulum laeve]|uniref:Uncharacterized protein n=1 Tax=Crucibulum laeve TaxID=68775 RepID=A0A5C3M046_9AGAR|nr:hypothetical protein BDQ12DRAFT_666642 [Crucibulum laeve]
MLRKSNIFDILLRLGRVDNCAAQQEKRTREREALPSTFEHAKFPTEAQVHLIGSKLVTLIVIVIAMARDSQRFQTLKLKMYDDDKITASLPGINICDCKIVVHNVRVPAPLPHEGALKSRMGWGMGMGMDG